MNFFAKVKEIYDYREMISNLVRRDLRGRYKRSFFGFAWTFLNPLLQLVVYTIVFSTVMRMGIDKFYLFLFVALIPWTFFSASLAGGCGSMAAQGDMVRKIYFPREVLPHRLCDDKFCQHALLFCRRIRSCRSVGHRLQLLRTALSPLPHARRIRHLPGRCPVDLGRRRFPPR